MDLAELTNQIDTIHVLVALFAGVIAWASVNAIGLRLLARNLSIKTDEGKPRWSYATAQAGLRLLATLSGITTGIFTVWLIAL